MTAADDKAIAWAMLTDRLESALRAVVKLQESAHQLVEHARWAREYDVIGQAAVDGIDEIPASLNDIETCLRVAIEAAST